MLVRTRVTTYRLSKWESPTVYSAPAPDEFGLAPAALPYARAHGSDAGNAPREPPAVMTPLGRSWHVMASFGLFIDDGVRWPAQSAKGCR